MAVLMGQDGLYDGHVETVAPRYQILSELTRVCYWSGYILCRYILLEMQEKCYVLLNAIKKSVEIQWENTLLTV
jgi:hypothetical protein